MIKSFIVHSLKYSIVILISSVIGLTMLCLVYLLPTDLMENNVEPLRNIKWEQSEYLWSGIAGSYLNNYTDAFMLNTAICKGKGNIIEKANAAYSYEYTDNGVNSLQSYLRGEDGDNIVPYARYWNGYLIVLKPLLLVLSYNQIRVFNVVVQTILISFLLVLIWKNKREHVIPFLCSILLIHPYVISQNMHFSVVYYILLGSLIGFFLFRRKIEQNMDYWFLCIGIAVSFFELLTYPLITLVYMLIFEESMRSEKEEGLFADFRRIISYIWAWGVGYIGIWGIKWIISSMILKDNVIANAIGQVLYRSSGSDIAGNKVGRLEVLWLNMQDYFNPVTLYILVISLAAIMIFSFFEKRIWIESEGNYIVKLLVIALMPVMWLMAKTNHSYIHHWMTYRELAPSVFSILIVIESIVHKKIHKEDIQVSG